MAALIGMAGCDPQFAGVQLEEEKCAPKRLDAAVISFEDAKGQF